jgi:hypothetical protein
MLELSRSFSSMLSKHSSNSLFGTSTLRSSSSYDPQSGVISFCNTVTVEMLSATITSYGYMVCVISLFEALLVDSHLSFVATVCLS